MEFDKKLAATLLGLIADVTPEAHLKESYVLPRDLLGDTSSELIPKTTSPMDVLWHLFLLSKSELIFPVSAPALSLESMKKLLAKIPHRHHWEPEDKPLRDFCYQVLPDILPQYFLTMQGYEFLAEHRPQ